MYDAEDLMLARAQLDIARESGDADEILAARFYLKEVRRGLDLTPEADGDDDAYDLILQGS